MLSCCNANSSGNFRLMELSIPYFTGVSLKVNGFVVIFRFVLDARNKAAANEVKDI